MRETVSIRLKESEIRFIEEISKKQNIDKSTAARELIEYGKIYLAIKLYKEGKISLEKTAKELDLSISEAIDLLAEFGIQSPMDFEDYLNGYKLEKVF
jgi:predicted HTH domain antitoxin